MTDFQTHGAFGWNELKTPDCAGAANFYGQLLGWKFEKHQTADGCYRIAKLEDEKLGGIVGMKDCGRPIPPHWSCYITVDNADETAGECAALGGKVLVAPTDIEGLGRFAVLQDPQGAVFNIIARLDD